jgi:S1-C subfamily serine protease
MYPSTEGEVGTTIDGPKTTGSGFVVSTNGIIATNAHVIKSASKIELFFYNAFGTSDYSANVLLVDESNDVAY